jgi:diguanylate cyclase (GGDEF)-like protein
MSAMDDEEVPTVTQRTREASATASKNAYLIALSGQSLGKMFKVEDGETLIGRASTAHVHLDDQGVSRLHAKIVRQPDDTISLIDLKSRNGTFVERARVDERTLTDGDRIQIGSVTILKFSFQNALEEQFQKQLYESATRDSLTAAFNRRFFDEQLQKDVSHTKRHKTPLSLLMIDIDHFKAVNDTHGHTTGDRALAHVGQLIGGSIRMEDVFCRVGGEEFAVIMREATATQAVQMGERLRGLIEAASIDLEGLKLGVTISVGAAQFDPGRHAGPSELTEAADQALYAAKNGGRNRVCVAP